MSCTSNLKGTVNKKPSHPVLLVQDNKGKRIIHLDQNIYSLGRESGNSIVIYSKLVSRRHATLLRVTNPGLKNAYSFQILDGDLQGKLSTNGLIINKKQCFSKELQPGDKIYFGGDAIVIYLMIDSDKSESEILELDQSDDLFTLSTLTFDPNDTLVTDNTYNQPLSESALIRLASFPELIPIPIIEINLFGEITYLNPAAFLQFPELQATPENHPFLAGIVSTIENKKKKFFVQEVEVDNLFFEASIYYIIESGLIRIYLIDITQRKQAEKELKRSHQELEIKVEQRTAQLKQSLANLEAEMAERLQAEALIRYQVLHDLLTGLPNRTMFNEHLTTAINYAKQNGSMLAVMFINLDRFKTINETLGHAVGDQLLQSISDRLTRCLRLGDPLARWGGDEFTVLLPHIHSVKDAIKVAQRIMNALKPAFYLQINETSTLTPPLHISTSIGIATYPQDGEDAQTLLINAGAALYSAKANGRNNYQFYLPEMNSQASSLLNLERLLHQAIEREEFIIYYQPQVNIKTGKITGMEALVRWQQPELGLVPPEQFIPIAEENGLIVNISEWVLRNACAQNKAWQDAGFSGLRMGINLSPRQFQEPHLVQLVADILAETGLAPEFLELEITESTVMQNVEFAKTMLHILEEMGVHISMDDFGTGYSSLSYLKKFPFHTLKIDQSFVRELKDNLQDMAIISAIIALGRSLNLRIIAEGVETNEQLELLRRLDCEQIQGYFFSRPLTVENATKFMQEYWAQSWNGVTTQ
ncbi:diguanylate cyclase/phosphodiesterase [Crinalium epipsammum PCC 9333]|uniref:Diguanylate cyclase/phosphodiesterase n=2 Tax=Crinalium TaxID=241421 RepID=K9W3I9_9CYAN|nr:diguanylate cyclase/phosphodiesterase [Crinalium epipsammum PCC 9333]